MYELEIYDKAYTNESRLIFSRKLSPREILQAVNKWNFYEWDGDSIVYEINGFYLED